jgi:predicted RNA-binding Zn-ribbon protein involved in translation (DUF1610 family)
MLSRVSKEPKEEHAMPVPIVDIRLEEDEEFMNLYCPACGRKMCGEGLGELCRHVAFIYIDEVCEFENLAPRLASLADEVVGECEEGDAHPVHLLTQRIESPTMLCLGVTWEGMACGPTSMKAYFGIDFGRAVDGERESGAGGDCAGNADQG